jgi:alkylation response protein AidB-like acyl-CoA dehydrogenase
VNQRHTGAVNFDFPSLDRRVNTVWMDLSYPADAESFRIEIRTWLEQNLPPGWMEAVEREEPFEMAPDQRKAFNEAWPSKLFEGGWICATWPKEYGGKGLTTMQGVVLSEEFAHAKAPLRADFFGDTLVGPTLLQWGTEEQKQEFLPRILNGTMRWCQGFSEPNSGSDLASLKTTAVLDGDEWVINGQKVWTTGGHHADYCFLLTRTDPDAPKHKGISYLLVPMRQPGVEVRGIVQPDGTAEFCEVFFTDARCPKDNVVGGVNNGWKVANSTLAFERGMSATTGYRRFEEEYKLMVSTATANGAIHDPLVRQRLMAFFTKIQILRVNGLRSLSATLTGSKDLGVMALGATNKMFWSEMHKAAMELALDIFGPASMLITTGPDAGSWPGAARDKRRDGYPVSPMMSSFFFSRSETIWGGTSQIQRNIVGERVLGLPKEPQATGA